jgi:GH25 family lysozyme M1 (1,4-beta-N-acetylmuramidase)
MGAPILIPDRYWQDVKANWTALGSSANFNGAILKATDGTSLPASEEWFKANWATTKIAAGDRYGDDFFRGAYHYLEFFDDGAEQAKHYLQTVEDAGDWDTGDLLPIVDVERGGSKRRNFAADAARIEDCLGKFTTALRDEMGADTQIILYAGGVFRDLNVQLSELCNYLWAARYGSALGSYEQYGWGDDRVALWQYTDGTYNYTAYPSEAPGLGRTDLSVYRGADLDAFKSALLLS